MQKRIGVSSKIGLVSSSAALRLSCLPHCEESAESVEVGRLLASIIPGHLALVHTSPLSQAFSVFIRVWKLIFFSFRDRMSLCSTDHPGTLSVDQSGFELTVWVLGLKACTTTAQPLYDFLIQWKVKLICWSLFSSPFSWDETGLTSPVCSLLGYPG